MFKLNDQVQTTYEYPTWINQAEVSMDISCEVESDDLGFLSITELECTKCTVIKNDSSLLDVYKPLFLSRLTDLINSEPERSRFIEFAARDSNY